MRDPIGYGFVVAAGFLVACGGDSPGGTSPIDQRPAPPAVIPVGGPVDGGGAGAGGAGGGMTDAGPVDSGPQSRQSEVVDTRPPFQMKSSAEIANTIDQCVGAGRRTVLDSMIQGHTCAAGPEDGTCAFLPAKFAAGDDVVFAQATEFDGDESALKSGTRPDQLTLPAVSAMQHVANTAGAQCAVHGQIDLCQCNTQQAAEAMIARCLPNISNAAVGYADAVTAFATTCAATGDPTAGPAHAIASLLASYAFMKAN